MNLISSLRLELNPAHPDVVVLVGAGGKTSVLFRLANEIASTGRRVVTTTTTRIFAAQMAQSPVHLTVNNGAVDESRLAALLDSHGQCLLVTGIEGQKAAGVESGVVDRVAAQAASLGIAAILVEADGSQRLPVKAPAPHEPVIPDSTTLLIPVLGLDSLGLKLAEPYVHRPQQLRALLGVEDAERRFTPEMAARLLVDPLGGAKRKPAGARLLPLLNKAEVAPRLAGGRLIARLLAAQAQSALIGNVGLLDRDPIRERWGSTAAVVLAAGGSRRMQQAKQLLELEGETLVVRAVRLSLESGASTVIVVTGAHAEAVHRALAPLGKAVQKRLRIVHNADWQAGQSTSVRTAVNALPPACEAAIFLPVDQPNVPVALLRRLWQIWRGGANLVAPTVEGELRGAPAIFDRRYFAQLRLLEGDRGAGPILKKESAAVATLATPAHWLQDVDTPDDWARLSTT
jgi:molybdenum cofactor cytidylyltransferase